MDIIDSPKSISKEIGRGTILDRWRLPDGTLYLDNAATRPMLPEVAEEMARLMANNPLNASSQHKYGQKAARMLEDARNFFKSELNVPSTGELIFNSGATEGLNMLLKSAYFADPTKNHIVTVKTEHKAVLNTCAYLETIGAEVTYLDVDEWGQMSTSELEASIRPNTSVVCVMRVNNETGVIAPTEDIAEICKINEVFYISDYTQSLGKESIDFSIINTDAIVASAHKIGGPVGIGMVVLKDKNNWSELINGGASSKELRGGTMGVGLAYALMKAFQKMDLPSHGDIIEAMSVLSANLKLQSLYSEQSKVVKSPFILPVSLPDSFRHDLYSESVIFSSGSACSDRTVQVSHVYQAMGHGHGRIRRLSF